MKGILIALAAAGALASTTVVANTTVASEPSIVRVQYYGERQYNQHERWDGRSLRIDEREARIAERIERGWNDGRLTRWEARRLQRELRGVEAKERAFKSDGRLDRYEVAQLNDDLDRLALNLRSQLRDEQRRY
jgi:hypothetical protein